MQYDLEKRTLDFARLIIVLASKVAPSQTGTIITSQFIRSGTSVGANYREANGASSRKDFRNKIAICKKEIQETVYWLILLKDIDIKIVPEIDRVLTEAQQLMKIFTKILATIDQRDAK